MRTAVIFASMVAAAMLALSQAVAQDDLIVDAPVPGKGGYQIVLNGLAAEMIASAEHLDTGERYDATRALDRALHLAEFGVHAFGLTERQRQPFRTAHDAVKKARHALQNGRPQQAAGILSTAGYKLKSSTIAGTGPSEVPDRTQDVEGLPVLNGRGRGLGELEGFERSEEGLLAIIAHGGFFVFGRETTAIPAAMLLGSKGFVVLPRNISPEEFRRGSPVS